MCPMNAFAVKQALLLLKSQLTSVKDLERLSCGCRAMDSLPWISRERAETMTAGCCGIAAVMQALAATEVTVKEADLMEGLIVELEEANGNQAIRRDEV
jgi:exopolyphosphatase/pppGpp-phosphohydrolase